MKTKNKLIIALSGCLCATAMLTAGAFAFLSSSVTKTEEAKVGTFDVSSELTISSDGTSIGKTMTQFTPGDVANINLHVSNNGNKSLATKSYIYILWDNDDFNKWSNHKDSIYVYGGYFATSKIKESMLNKEHPSPEIECQYLENVSYDNEEYSGYLFETPKVVLDGSKYVSDDEREEDFSGQTPQPFEWDSASNQVRFSGTYKYKFGFSNYANVHTEGKPFKIVSITKAIQNRNTNESDWETIDIHEIELGGNG